MYVEVILALPIEKTFFYYSETDILLGSYVQIPFSTQTCIGVVVNTSSTCTIDNLKDVEQVINIPTASTCFIEFIKWVGRYNIISVGALLKLALSGIKEDEKYYYIDSVENSKLTTSHKRVIDLVQRCGELNELDICNETKVQRKTLTKMLESNFLKLCTRPVLQNKQVICNIKLSGEQEQVYKTLSQYSQYKVILLDGVTGSGKTEVYLSTIANILEQNCNAQALVLLPEIVLATQVEERFNKYFKSVNIVKWHSALLKKHRQNNWWKIVTGKAQIIIGARSALFLPYNNLKIIVVDEEHDTSFKQSVSKINYHARDMAIVRAKKENIPILLSSATPSLESFHNAQSGKFEHVLLSARHTNVQLPTVQVIDMRKHRNDKWISTELYNAIRETIEKKKQALLFLNRRGYSPFTVCNQCGYKPHCVNCSVWLVKHKKYNMFLCHYCGYKLKSSNFCPECSSEGSLIPYGAGVERIEEEVRSELSCANVMVISSDVITNVGKGEELLGIISAGGVDIIIGTQVVTKGHHFPKLDLVGVIDADASLYGGDLRSTERTYQILQQVSGRAGREQHRGKVLLQSHNPNNIITKYLCNKKDFYCCELQSRKQSNMPPFTKITTLVINSIKHDQAISISNGVATALTHKKLRVLGPVPANIHLINKKYLYKVIVISPKDFDIQFHIRNCMLIQRYYKVINVDVDSIDLF